MLQNPYIQNILSEFIALGIIFFVGWVIYHFTTRRRLLSFFGVKDSKRIVLYLSNLRVLAGGALGIDGIPRSFGESAIPLYESNLVSIFQRLFNFVIPGIESQPGFLKWVLLSDVTVEILASPLSEANIVNNSTFISIGSPGYNLASKRVEDSFNPIGRFTADNSAIELSGIPPLTDLTYGFVQRVLSQDNKQTAFYVGGVSSLGTTGAAMFLAKRWRYLAKKYPEGKPFCVILKVAVEDSSKQEIVLERG